MYRVRDVTHFSQVENTFAVPAIAVFSSIERSTFGCTTGSNVFNEKEEVMKLNHCQEHPAVQNNPRNELNITD